MAVWNVNKEPQTNFKRTIAVPGKIQRRRSDQESYIIRSHGNRYKIDAQVIKQDIKLQHQILLQSDPTTKWSSECTAILQDEWQNLQLKRRPEHMMIESTQTTSQLFLPLIKSRPVQEHFTGATIIPEHSTSSVDVGVRGDWNLKEKLNHFRPACSHDNPVVRGLTQNGIIGC